MEHTKSADSFGRIHNQIEPIVYFENIPGSSLREPEVNLYGDYLRPPWGATPFNPRDKRIAKYQKGMTRLERQMLKGKPSCVYGDMEDYVETMFLARDANRTTNNSYSISDMLHGKLLETNSEVQDMYERASLGKASPLELLNILELLGMGSIELARLTHLYGYRLEHLETMRQVIRDMITEKNGEVFDDPPEELRVVAFDRSVTASAMVENALTVKRKRLVGLVGETRIYERTSFIIRIDEISDFNPELAQKIRQIVTDETIDMQLDPEIEAEIRRLVEGNDLISTIPLSTTVYAQNPATQESIERKNKLAKNRAKQEAMRHFPELSRIALGGEAELDFN
ncbi:MAG TPA: hypothetical protein PLZ58_04295 [Candidatus Saccharibacteria bacterium]|nr:hypothetical protein [Candidatus Saccharibacteria bacterium]HRQ06743.1 hypothetical protein [Candidatus Saccharibacteria bacterium]